MIGLTGLQTKCSKERNEDLVKGFGATAAI